MIRIQTGLEEMAESTLLFLSHIEKIRWEVTGGQEYCLFRAARSEHHIEIVKKIGKKPIRNSHFLRY